MPDFSANHDVLLQKNLIASSLDLLVAKEIVRYSCLVLVGFGWVTIGREINLV